MLDVTNMIQPKSDQINAEDLLTGPIIVRITGASKGSAEQPLELALEGRRPWRPCKTTMRLLATAWGPDADAWVGRSAELFRDPAVKWGGAAVGGIRILRLSHIDKPLSLALSETKGKRQNHTVKPLPVEQSYPDALAALGIRVEDVAAFCAANGKKSPADGNDAYRANLVAALATAEGRAKLDAWLGTRQPGSEG